MDKTSPHSLCQEMFLIMKTSIVLNIGHVWAFPFPGWFRCISSGKLRAASNRPSSRICRKNPGKAGRPEKHQCLGIHNNVAWPLPESFVSATLALREALSISCRETGIPAPHPSRVLSPVDGQLPRPFPHPPTCSLVCRSHRLETAAVHRPRAITLCTGIHHPGRRWTMFPLFLFRAHQDVAVTVSSQ